MVLSALAAAIFTYTTANQGVAKRQQADQRAYGLAETGLSYALSRLQNAADPTNAGNVPSTTVSLTGGTTTYSGSLSGTTWTLTSTGTVANPSGPHAGNVVRTVSMQAADHDDDAGRHAAVGLPLRRPAVGLHHDGEQRDHGRSLYVRGNLCLTNNSQVEQPGRPPAREPLRREQRADRQRGDADRRVRRDGRVSLHRRRVALRSGDARVRGRGRARARRRSPSRPSTSRTGTRTRSSARSRPARRARSRGDSTTTRR